MVPVLNDDLRFVGGIALSCNAQLMSFGLRRF